MTLDYVSPWRAPELEAFRDTCRRFFETEVAPHSQRWRQAGFVDRDVWRAAGRVGLLCASVPEEFGGSGGTYAHEAVIMEELNRIGETGFGIVPGAVLAPQFVLAAATPAQAAKWLPRVASGEAVLGMAITEPSAGSDVNGIRTTARRDGDHYVLNGSKTFISNGMHADMVLVTARTGNTGTQADHSLFMLEDTRANGYRHGSPMEKIGQQGQDTTELFFDDVRVPASSLVGDEEGQGFRQLMRALAIERVSTGVLAVAAMERAVRLTTEHAKQRAMFGKTLFDMQNTRFKLAECSTRSFVTRVFVDRLVDKLARGEHVSNEEASMAKLWSAQQQCIVVDECLQLFGGYGYMAAYPIATMYVDSRIQRIYGGADEVQKEIIARAL
ncbi:MAG: acyl-CoA dehydrogenase family protein [Rubrivivax sp.]